MLKGNSENRIASPGALWFPGVKMEGFEVAPPSARAREIARSREELLGLLRDLPESEYELSLTDLVEKGSVANNSAAKDKNSPEGERDRASSAVKERKKRRNSRGSCGSSSDGVLLNFYVPASLTRSLTAPRSSSRASRVAAHGHMDITDCNKRDREPTTLGCWSAFWERGRGKFRRQALERTR
ncbi:uncharacterized protein LOC103718491 [Phoenix dactylifera]|uniref:Uncharacterized protein LOC103718491 n=1 Tax=Phoenix dactylifera TaxID=42345 RepID=A0A8B7CSI9_PHODC|nr:uncharacterized protein LOC103718491 [Phoenix dactylifera]